MYRKRMRWTLCRVTAGTPTAYVTVRRLRLHKTSRSILGVLTDDIIAVWSNFEIADMDFWRSEAYMAYFAFLDAKGGFYYEVSGAVSAFFESRLISEDSDGGMRQSIRSPCRCSRGRIRSISFERSDIGIRHTSTVRKGTSIERGSAGATKDSTLITTGT